jgi:hypothetical protein
MELRIRELPDEPSLHADPARRGRDVIAFTSMASDSGLALGPVTSVAPSPPAAGFRPALTTPNRSGGSARLRR